VRDLEERTRHVIIDEGDKQTRREQIMQKNHARELGLQRNQIGEAAEQKVDSAEVEKRAVRSDSEFKARLAQREFGMKYNETVKNYEKVIADMKDEHEDILRDVRLESERNMKDLERRARMAYEEQQKAHQFQLAESELQQKERERAISASYEAELEKMRKTNQMLSKKRG